MADKLTPEEIQKVGRLLDEAASLDGLRAKTTDSVIASEGKLQSTRIANLNTYFDAYEEKLDKIIKKGSSMLNEQLAQFVANSSKELDTFVEKVNKIKDSTNNNSTTADLDPAASQKTASSTKNTKESSSSTISKSNFTSNESTFKLLKNIDANIGSIASYFAASGGAGLGGAEKSSGRGVKQKSGATSTISELMKNTDLLHRLGIDPEDDDAEARLTAITSKTGGKKSNPARTFFTGTLKERSLKERVKDLAPLVAMLAVTIPGAGAAGAASAKATGSAVQASKATGVSASKAAGTAADIANASTAASMQEKSEASSQEVAKADAEASTLASQTPDMTDGATAINTASGGLGGATAIAAVIINALSTAVQSLQTKIDDIAASQGHVDTRLYGSSNETYAGSYWRRMVKDIVSVGAISPYFKQEDFAKNIQSLVDQGIAFDIEQRAFLMTIKDKIATTFNVADGTLLRLIRIQQEDSTAGRLGMEASLNAFLNNMYETTEYLNSIASSVRNSLEEMEALMEGAEATEVEYQVQKWLGSLYSVGMSESAVKRISDTLGQIASGQIEGLTGNGAGNLLIMAANNAGIPITDILASGISSEDTNKLLQAVVSYMAELAESSKDNNVVQQQLANVFGVKASDLRAATNIVGPAGAAGAGNRSLSAIYANGQGMTYNDMINHLFGMAMSIEDRTSLGEASANMWNNLMYSLAGGIASDPLSYALLRMATLLDDTTGGIAIPALSVMGNGVDLETTVADLMRVGALGGGIISTFGSLVSGIGNSFSGRKALEQLGIKSESGLAITPRGSGYGSAEGVNATVSESAYIGNSSDSDIKNSTLQEAEDTKTQLMVEAQEESEANQVSEINTTILKIYELLDEVANGNSCFKVKVEGYGLTKTSNSNSLGGVSALSDFGSSSSGSDFASSGVNAGGSGNNNINFGGWTTTL